MNQNQPQLDQNEDLEVENDQNEQDEDLEGVEGDVEDGYDNESDIQDFEKPDEFESQATSDAPEELSHNSDDWDPNAHKSATNPSKGEEADFDEIENMLEYNDTQLQTTNVQNNDGDSDQNGKISNLLTVHTYR